MERGSTAATVIASRNSLTLSLVPKKHFCMCQQKFFFFQIPADIWARDGHLEHRETVLPVRLLKNAASAPSIKIQKFSAPVEPVGAQMQWSLSGFN